MKIIPRGEWLPWMVENYANALVVFGELEPSKPGRWGMLLHQLYNTKIAIVDHVGPEESWCYPLWTDAVIAFGAWAGYGDPGDKWIRHVTKDSRCFRRNPDTGEVREGW